MALSRRDSLMISAVLIAATLVGVELELLLLKLLADGPASQRDEAGANDGTEVGVGRGAVPSDAS